MTSPAEDPTTPVGAEAPSAPASAGGERTPAAPASAGGGRTPAGGEGAPAATAVGPSAPSTTGKADEASPPSAPVGVSRRVLTKEIWLVLALSLGASGVAAVISFAGVLTSSKPISGQTAVIVGSRAPGRP